MRTDGHTTLLSDNHVNLACFEARGRTYALEVSQVREIVRWQEVTPLPMAPRLIEGVVDLRGRVIPVVDLCRLLGGERTDASGQARIAILEIDGLVLGLCVEAATDVLSLDVGMLEDVPDLATQAGYDAIRHVVRRPGRAPVMVLSLEHMLESVYRSVLPERRGEEQ